jgi:hypothetical protein
VALATSLAHVLSAIDVDDVVVVDLRDPPPGHFDAAIVNEGAEVFIDAAVVIELPGAGSGATPELRVTAAGVSWAQHFASADDLLDALDAHVPGDAVRHPT